MAYASFINANVGTQSRGTIVRAGAPGQCLLAQADILANAQKLLGVRLGDVLSGASGPFGSFCEPGARIRLAAPANINDVIYLSAATPGVGTTTPPSIPIALGICYEVVNISGVDYADIIPIVVQSGSGGSIVFTAKGDLPSYDGSAVLIVPLGTVPGQVLMVDPGAPVGFSWQALSNPLGWSTAYSVDFSTLPNQTISADGAVTIDGKTFYAFNKANSQTFAVQNGSGLYIRCSAANTTLTTNVSTFPGLYAKFTDLTGLLETANWSECWVWFMFSQPHVPNANYEWAAGRIITVPSSYTPANLNGFSLARGYGTGGMGYQAFAHFGTGATVSAKGWVNSATVFDVMAFHLIGGQVEHYLGQSVAGAFPNRTALQLMGRTSLFGTAAVPTYDGFCASFGVMSGNTAAASDLMMMKMLVQYR